MMDRKYFRVLMIAAGILAAIIIVISPAFRAETERVVTELSGEAESTEEATQVSAVSGDAITSPQAVEVESANPFVIQEVITANEPPARLPLPAITLPAATLTTLLRSVISPQAP